MSWEGSEMTDPEELALTPKNARARLEDIAQGIFGKKPEEVPDEWFQFWWHFVEAAQEANTGNR